jgi:hypothetical protein
MSRSRSKKFFFGYNWLGTAMSTANYEKLFTRST